MADSPATLPSFRRLPTLELLSSATFSGPVAAGHAVACNPAIDLAAAAAPPVAGEAGGAATVQVWRAGDRQLVWKHVERGRKVEGVRWKEDGQFLAVGWSDGVVRLLGLEGGKAVHHIRVCGDDGGAGGAAGDSSASGPTAKIEFIAWSRNVTGEGRRRRKREQAGAPARHWERMLQLDGDRAGDPAVDLPHELTFLDVETALPKLSPLPVSGGSGDDMFLFSTTTSLESVFRPCRADDADDVHVMVVGTTDGGIHLSIHDSFVIGTLRCSPSGDGVLREWDHMTLYLLPMHLTFLSHSPVNLSLLASTTTTLQNLLRYLKQTQSHMASEWKSTRDLPERFMMALQDDLKKMPNGDMTVVQALYHTVVTGHLFPPVKEWLADSLAERGHKRWEKAVVSGLKNLRSLVHENFMPALERCGVILSRLLGIACFHDAEENIGFDEAQIHKLVDIVSCLMLVAHKVLTTVMDELEHFNAFSIWLRSEIDKQGSSSVSEDLTEKEVTMDHVKVLTYIRHYLATTPLALYFDEASKEDYVRDQQLVEPGPSLLELLDKQLQEQETGRPYMKVLPRLDFLLNYLTSRASRVFGGIAEAEKQRVEFGKAEGLSIGQKIWKHEMWMSQANQKETAATVFTAMIPEDDRTRMYILRTNIPLEDGIGDVQATTSTGFALPDNTSVVDFKYLDENSLLVLCSRKEEPRWVLVRIAYRSPQVPYMEYTEGQCPSVVHISGLDAGGFCSYFTFAHLASFLPMQMMVQRASTLRGEIPARVCLLGRDRATYRTYVLPEEWGERAAQT